MRQSPFPQGTTLPGDIVLGRVVTARHEAFWIHAARDGGRVLLMTDEFVASLDEHMRPLELPNLTTFTFGNLDYQMLAAKGMIDVVVTESLDRLSRSQADIAALRSIAGSACLPRRRGRKVGRLSDGPRRNLDRSARRDQLEHRGARRQSAD